MSKLLGLREFAFPILIAMTLFVAVACGQETETVENTAASGPFDAPAAAVAEVPNLPKAPDFILPAANKNNAEISLSSFQDEKEVVLVFYRAYW